MDAWDKYDDYKLDTPSSYDATTFECDRCNAQCSIDDLNESSCGSQHCNECFIKEGIEYES